MNSTFCRITASINEDNPHKGKVFSFLKEAKSNDCVLQTRLRKNLVSFVCFAVCAHLFKYVFASVCVCVSEVSDCECVCVRACMACE